MNKVELGRLGSLTSFKTVSAENLYVKDGMQYNFLAVAWLKILGKNYYQNRRSIIKGCKTMQIDFQLCILHLNHTISASSSCELRQCNFMLSQIQSVFSQLALLSATAFLNRSLGLMFAL